MIPCRFVSIRVPATLPAEVGQGPWLPDEVFPCLRWSRSVPHVLLPACKAWRDWFCAH